MELDIPGPRLTAFRYTHVTEMGSLPRSGNRNVPTLTSSMIASNLFFRVTRAGAGSVPASRSCVTELLRFTLTTAGPYAGIQRRRAHDCFPCLSRLHMVGSTSNRRRTLSRARAGAHIDNGAMSRAIFVDSHFTVGDSMGADGASSMHYWRAQDSKTLSCRVCD
jgi:hypothetical protein